MDLRCLWGANLSDLPERRDPPGSRGADEGRVVPAVVGSGMSGFNSMPNGWAAMSAAEHGRIASEHRARAETWPDPRVFLGWVTTALMGWLHTEGRLEREALAER